MSKKNNSTFRWMGLLLLILLLTQPGFTKSKKVQESLWTSTPVVIDGNTGDWQDIKPFEDKKLKINYAFKNDAAELYVMFVFNDLNFISTLESSGMTMWLNNNGKKGKTYGIKFLRRTVTADHFIALMERQYGTLPDEKKQEIKKKDSYTIYQNGILDKKSNDIIPVIVASEKAPAFKTGRTQEQLVFEFRIPLANEEGKILGIGTSPGNEVMVGFEWGGMTKEYKEMMKKRRRMGGSYRDSVASDMPGSDEASEIGGSMDSGGSTDTDFAYSRVPKKYSFWVPLKIAVK